MNAKTVIQDFWASYSTGAIEETWSRYIADEVVLHPPAGVELTRESWKAFERDFVASFDSVVVEVHDQVSEGSKVASRWTLTAVNQKAEFMGVPPTGRSATTTAMTIDVVDGSKIVEHWSEVALAAFLGQLSA
ncbi:ester cyclase [Mycobacterium sp. URHB0044]|jgi:predicted ester cyclase|uniref:ester cyclase n=1 Tax=Mycobacterium sp. URHB0044 TaxID=1380386 RepID=UPI0006883D79|nr:ester cyclase [Mycobacterium sp. URHB0044]